MQGQLIARDLVYFFFAEKKLMEDKTGPQELINLMLMCTGGSDCAEANL